MQRCIAQRQTLPTSHRWAPHQGSALGSTLDFRYVTSKGPAKCPRDVKHPTEGRVGTRTQTHKHKPKGCCAPAMSGDWQRLRRMLPQTHMPPFGFASVLVGWRLSRPMSVHRRGGAFCLAATAAVEHTPHTLPQNGADLEHELSWERL